MTFKEFAKNELNYDLKTTYWDDFTIAEHFGDKAIVDTFKNAIREHKGDYKILTELCLILNHKIWYHYQTNEPLAQIYNTLWETLDSWCVKNLKGDELKYFYRTLD